MKNIWFCQKLHVFKIHLFGGWWDKVFWKKKDEVSQA